MTRPTNSRLSSRLSAVAAIAILVAMIALAFGSTFLTVRDTRHKARAEFVQVQRSLRETEEARRLLESRIESLRTQVDSVRLQARNEFRLILPGERIEVFTAADSPQSSGRLLAHTLP